MLGAVLLTLGVASLNIPPAASAIKAAAVTINVLIPSGAWRPLQWATPSPTQKDIRVQSGERNLIIRLYYPARLPQTGLVIYTPFIGGKLDDPRLTNLAETFARAGFLVATPIPERDSIAVSTNDAEDVITAAQLVLQEVSAVGLFGISYGNGPTFAAAADARINDRVVFLVSLNGMYDLKNLIEFIETGTFAYQDTAYTLTPHQYTKDILEATRQAEHIPPGADLVTSQAFARLRLSLSPASHVSAISVPVFLIHAATDSFIPYTETMRLRDALADRVPTSFLLTDVIEHGSYHKLTLSNLKRRYLPALVGFYRSIRYILTFAAGA